MPRDDQGVTIDNLSPGQLDSLVEAQNRIFEDYIIPIRSSRQMFIDFLGSVGGDLRNVLVALDGDEIVGYATPVMDGREAWIGGIGVVPSHRRRGIATELMLAAEELCRKKGVLEISLEVIQGNDQARRVYDRLGYSDARTFLTAEGRPTKFEGFGEMPRPASREDVVRMHSRTYGDSCWQKRKVQAVQSSARSAECYAVDGGFVLVRAVDTSGFIPFLGVVPEKRRQGLGTSLTRFALTRLWNLGAFKVTVYNVNDDAPTLRLLDMFDFRVILKQTEMRKTLLKK